MTVATQIIPIQPQSPSQGFRPASEQSALTLELAKCLKLVAASSMNADAQTMWLAAAVDALEDIRASEVAAVSAEIRRSVTRPAQIVPEIARLVSEKRRRTFRDTPETDNRGREFQISREAQERRGKARNQAEVEDAYYWEREARAEVGLHVSPLPQPLSRDELDKMPAHIASLGLKYGFLTRRDGQLIERATR